VTQQHVPSAQANEFATAAYEWMGRIPETCTDEEWNIRVVGMNTEMWQRYSGAICHAYEVFRQTQDYVRVAQAQRRSGHPYSVGTTIGTPRVAVRINRISGQYRNKLYRYWQCTVTMTDTNGNEFVFFPNIGPCQAGNRNLPDNFHRHNFVEGEVRHITTAVVSDNSAWNGVPQTKLRNVEFEGSRPAFSDATVGNMGATIGNPRQVAFDQAVADGVRALSGLPPESIQQVLDSVQTTPNPPAPARPVEPEVPAIRDLELPDEPSTPDRVLTVNENGAVRYVNTAVNPVAEILASNRKLELDDEPEEKK